MLAKSNRLIREKDFKTAYRQGFGRGTPSLAIKIRPNNHGITRFGLVVSVKVDKSSVARNRIRRRLSECIGRCLNKILPGFDIVLVAKKDLAESSFDEIEQELHELLEKNRLLARQ